MKYFLVCTFLLFSLASSAQQAPSGSKTEAVAMERMPKADYDIGTYISENLHYPDSARMSDIEGRVIVKFIVNEDGHISDCTIMKGIGGGCDEEAQRVVCRMPPWQPGIQKGKPVKVYFSLPIVFKLDDGATAAPAAAQPSANGAYGYVQVMPEPGYDLEKYLAANVHYPKEALKEKIEGRVLIKFVVNQDGSISDCSVSRGIGLGCDEEALRVIKGMPSWKPGKQDGQPRKVWYYQPVVFKATK